MTDDETGTRMDSEKVTSVVTCLSIDCEEKTNV
jgi:hypothetical protein